VERVLPLKRTNDSESTIRINEGKSLIILVLSYSLIGGGGGGKGIAPEEDQRFRKYDQDQRKGLVLPTRTLLLVDPGAEGVERALPLKRTNDSESTIRINEGKSLIILVLFSSSVRGGGGGNGFAL
jgi:hypothetical protein